MEKTGTRSVLSIVVSVNRLPCGGKSAGQNTNIRPSKRRIAQSIEHWVDSGVDVAKVIGDIP